MANKAAVQRGGVKALDSQVTQDYLKAVWAASEWGGPGASVTRLASRLGVAASTASENVSRLVEAGLLEHEPYRAVTLTQAGRELAVGQIRRHRLLETYLVQRLGFGWDEVHEEAEVLEHAISERLLERLDLALGRPTRDPHGDPIPRADGTITEPRLRAVESLQVGESGVVARIADDPQLLAALDAAGIGLDDRVRLESWGTVPEQERPSRTARSSDRRRREQREEDQVLAGRVRAVVITKVEECGDGGPGAPEAAGRAAAGEDRGAAVTVPVDSLWLLA
ncbi:Iron-dependent repressor IdeR [Actinomyces bovis]|uniref:Manganese transport regulator n=1 Tax=Actinomyces bovis TaxID=1658 RepID=A0ABY1VKB9_9ACTO|nr:metal-dependent transcriptional regulator [Actinomyces bovis]SPT52541.1 Iron-dependent repressor IdeR [Actinomyces bovis]VEG54296.1 Iron-dependent repressor IdeR [Actinomyces israelii]